MPGHHAPHSVRQVKPAPWERDEPDLFAPTGANAVPAPSAAPVYTAQWARALGRAPDDRPRPGHTPGLGARELAKIGERLQAGARVPHRQGMPVQCASVLGVAPDGSEVEVRIQCPAGHVEVFRMKRGLAMELALQLVDRLSHPPLQAEGSSHD